MKSIIITVSELGEITVEASGFKGKACEAETEKFIKALGVATSKKFKPEFFQEDKIKQGN